MKRIAILGSTGSIGTQALEVIAQHPHLFELYAITGHNNVELLVQQARRFQPEVVCIANGEHYQTVSEKLADLPLKVFAGIDAIADLMQMDSIDLVLTAMVGYAGLKPTIAAIEAGKTIALANKETLVVAGDLICDLAQKSRSAILPVDSEHSAIFQCLAGEGDNLIEKVILTASGGPFRGKKGSDLTHVTAKDALKHPNWSMGAKITIDSATLMNKGFEMIEAKWLFGLQSHQIEVLVHPQSIIHSMVQFADSSIKAQLGLPDMRLPIQYAFTYPERPANTFERLNFSDFPQLTFEKPDMETFRNLALAFKSVEVGGNMPCVINAANEVAVEAFLQDKVGFLQMTDLIETAMAKATFVQQPTYDDYVATDCEVRRLVRQLIK